MDKNIKEEHVKNDFKSVDFKWLCPNCNALLGFVSNPDCTTVRMKYKDFYVSIIGGQIAHPCRRCGKVAVLTQQNPPEKKRGETDS